MTCSARDLQISGVNNNNNNNNMCNSASNLRKHKCETQSEEHCAVRVVAAANLRGKAR